MAITSYEQLVKLWMTDKRPKEIAEELGVTPTTVSAHIGALRKAGVNLPRKSVSKKEIDVTALNAIVAATQS